MLKRTGASDHMRLAGGHGGRPHWSVKGRVDKLSAGDNDPAMTVTEDPPAAAVRGARRRIESRRRLLAAARTLFVSRGYHATRPQDIAREADVGNGTFYLHFTDKRDIFLAFAEEACNELRAELEGPLSSAGSLVERLSAGIEAAFDFGERNVGLVAAALMDLHIIDPSEPIGSRQRDQLAEGLAHVLACAQRSGEMRADLDPLILAHALIGMVEQAGTHAWKARTERADLMANLNVFVTALVATPHTPPTQTPDALS